VSEAFRITWQVRAGLEEVSAWSALVVADSEEQARHLVWERIRSGGLRSRETSRLTVEAVRAPFVHIQKGELWGEPWSVEIGFRSPLDADQLAGGETVRSLRLSVPASSEEEARSRAAALVLDALAGGDQVEVRARQALPVWAWEQHTLDST